MKKQKIFFRTGVFFFCAFFTFCCGAADGNGTGNSETSGISRGDKKVLQVEGSDYSTADFNRFLNAVVGSDRDELDEGALSRLFDAFVDEKILLHKSRASGVTISETEKRDYLVRLKVAHSSDEYQDMTEEEKNLLFDRLQIEKYVLSLVQDIQVADREIQDYYKEHKREFLKTERVQVSQILSSSMADASKVLEKVRGADEAVFRSTARELSIGVESARGGQMGIFELGQLPYEMEEVVFSLKEGEVSQVVESPYGFHVFRLDKKLDVELISEDEARDAIETRIRDRKMEKILADHLSELKRTLDWVSSPENLPFPYIKE